MPPASFTQMPWAVAREVARWVKHTPCKPEAPVQSLTLSRLHSQMNESVEARKQETEWAGWHFTGGKACAGCTSQLGGSAQKAMRTESKSTAVVHLGVQHLPPTEHGVHWAEGLEPGPQSQS